MRATRTLPPEAGDEVDLVQLGDPGRQLRFPVFDVRFIPGISCCFTGQRSASAWHRCHRALPLRPALPPVGP